MNYKSLCIAFIVLIAIAIVGCNNSDSSQESNNSTKANSPQIHKDVTNAICPVTEEPIDKKIFITYKGKKIYFCCKDCIAKFNKSPEKYLAVLDKETHKEHQQGEKHQPGDQH